VWGVAGRYAELGGGGTQCWERCDWVGLGGQSGKGWVGAAPTCRNVDRGAVHGMSGAKQMCLGLVMRGMNSIVGVESREISSFVLVLFVREDGDYEYEGRCEEWMVGGLTLFGYE